MLKYSIDLGNQLLQQGEQFLQKETNETYNHHHHPAAVQARPSFMHYTSISCKVVLNTHPSRGGGISIEKGGFT